VFIHFVRHITVANVRDHFRPGQRRSFAVRVVGRLLPMLSRVDVTLPHSLRNLLGLHPSDGLT